MFEGRVSKRYEDDKRYRLQVYRSVTLFIVWHHLETLNYICKGLHTNGKRPVKDNITHDTVKYFCVNTCKPSFE